MSLVFAGGKIQSVLCLRSQLAGEGAQGEGGGWQGLWRSVALPTPLASASALQEQYRSDLRKSSPNAPRRSG